MVRLVSDRLFVFERHGDDLPIADDVLALEDPLKALVVGHNEVAVASILAVVSFGDVEVENESEL